MRTRLGIIQITVVLALAWSATAVATPRSTIARASCSKATARRLVNQYRINPFFLSQPVVQLLCGPFTGPRSQAMLVTVGAATCWSPQQWAVFRFTGGAWRLVADKYGFIIPPVRATGGDVTVTSPVSRPGDSRCNPTGGTLTQTWHWIGSRFVVVVGKRTPPPTHVVEFYDRSLSRVVGCEIDDSTVVAGGGQVVCTSYSSTAVQKAVLNGSGQVVVCTQPVHGPTDPCQLGNLGDPIPTYGVGQSVAVGGFRCQVLQAGLQCTVIASGKGFLFGPSAVTPVGGATLRTTSSGGK